MYVIWNSPVKNWILFAAQKWRIFGDKKVDSFDTEQNRVPSRPSVQFCGRQFFIHFQGSAGTFIF